MQTTVIAKDSKGEVVLHFERGNDGSLPTVAATMDKTKQDILESFDYSFADADDWQEIVIVITRK